MRSVGIREAQAHLSKLVDQAARGEPFVITRSGRPLVKVTALEGPVSGARRLGFMAGAMRVPPEFDHMHAMEVGRVFDGSED